MRSLLLRSCAFLVTVVILVSGLFIPCVTSAEEYSKSDEDGSIKTMTLYRYGPDGSIRLVRMDVKCGKSVDLASVFAEKCLEMVENDIELQDFIFGNESLINVVSSVTSFGGGFHFKSSIRLPFMLMLRRKIFSRLPIRCIIPLVFCRYEDEHAKTTIKTLSIPCREETTTTIIEGNHTIIATGFVGYAGWLGFTSQLGQHLGIRTGFAGYTLFTGVRKQ